MLCFEQIDESEFDQLFFRPSRSASFSFSFIASLCLRRERRKEGRNLCEAAKEFEALKVDLVDEDREFNGRFRGEFGA